MRKRYYDLLSVLILYLLVASTAFAQSQGPTPSTPKTSQEQQNKAEPKQTEGKSKQGIANITTSIKNIEAQPTDTKKTDKTKHSNEKSSTDWWRILFDALLVFFTGVLAWSTINLWQSTKKLWKVAQAQSDDMKYSIVQAQRSADAMQSVANSMAKNIEITKQISDRQEQFGKMQMRAYLSVMLLGEIPQDRNTGWRYTIQMNITNLGNTPAHEVKCAMRTEIMEFPLAEGIDLSLFPPTTWTATAWHIDPRQTHFIGASLDSLVSDDVIRKFKQEISPRLYVWGTIWYKDVFGDSHNTNFCQFFTWDITNKLFSHNANRHNNAT